MLLIRQTPEFAKWFLALRDARDARAAEGSFGDVKPVGGGGDKASQDRDIGRAQKIARDLEE